MNKYLNRYNESIKTLEQEFKENGYDVLAKMHIAAEIDSILDNYDEFEKIKLTDKQQEKIIDITATIYMNLEDDEGFYNLTKAVMFTLLEYKTYKSFIKNWKNNEYEVWDKITWRL